MYNKNIPIKKVKREKEEAYLCSNLYLIHLVRVLCVWWLSVMWMAPAYGTPNIFHKCKEKNFTLLKIKLPNMFVSFFLMCLSKNTVFGSALRYLFASFFLFLVFYIYIIFLLYFSVILVVLPQNIHTDFAQKRVQVFIDMCCCLRFESVL